MTAAAERQEAEAVAPDPAGIPTPAGARGRASSIPRLLPHARQEAPGPDDPSLSATALGAAHAAGEQARKLLTGRSLLHIDPPSVGATWTAHRQAALHWNAPLMQWARSIWGLVHIAVLCGLYGLLWVLFSPARTFVAVLIVTAWKLWS